MSDIPEPRICECGNTITRGGRYCMKCYKRMSRNRHKKHCQACGKAISKHATLCNICYAEVIRIAKESIAVMSGKSKVEKPIEIPDRYKDKTVAV